MKVKLYAVGRVIVVCVIMDSNPKESCSGQEEVYFFSSPKSRVLNKTCPRLTYQTADKSTCDGIIQKGLHFGQRKLLLSEVEFFTGILSQDSHPPQGSQPLLVVYAGAANGQHLPFLFQLFPQVRFVLIDPAPFCAEVRKIAEDSSSSNPIVELVSGYCTAELCDRLHNSYASEYRLVLVSDIRSGVPTKMTKNQEHTEMMERDNDLQREYCNHLHPLWGMLKFHPPYPAVTDKQSPRYDPTDSTPETINYLSGMSLFGVWSPKSSSEVRLVVSGPFPHSAEIPYSCRGHEEMCYHYNCTRRYQSDCDAERFIWQQYLAVCPSTVLDKEHLASPAAISEEASRKLKHPLFTPLTEGFTEDHARWFALVSSVKGIQPATLNTVYTKWVQGMSVDRVIEIIRMHRDSNEIPSAASTANSEGAPLDNEFWSVFCRGDFAAAYSVSAVRWKFFRLLPSLPGATSVKRDGNRPQRKRRANHP